MTSTVIVDILDLPISYNSKNSHITFPHLHKSGLSFSNPDLLTLYLGTHSILGDREIP